MSIFSSKCDLYDHMMMEKMYDKGSCRVSDELECFKIFKQKTNGVIYQHREILVSEWNQEYVKSKCDGKFDFIEHIEEIEDKRLKQGKRIRKYFTYIYWDKVYNSLKDLNKHGVFITEEIHFDTLLDIIPYYPYIITMSFNDQNKSYIYIGTEPYYMSEYKHSLKIGGNMLYPEQYIQSLSRHYKDVVQTYYSYKINERLRSVVINDVKPFYNGCYELQLPTQADSLHQVEFVWDDEYNHPHWTSPKLFDDHTVLISKEDVEYYLKNDINNGTISIKYVEACELPNIAK